MPSRLTLALALVCLVLAGLLYGSLRWGAQEAAAATQLQGKVTELEATQERLEQRLRGLQGELQRQRTARAPTEKALEQNPDWRDTAVPGAVSDGLCQRLKCR